LSQKGDPHRYKGEKPKKKNALRRLEMNRKTRSLLLPMIALLLAVLACGPRTSQADINLAVTQTLQALAREPAEAETGGEVTGETGEESQAAEATEEPPAIEEPTDEPTATPTVEHSVIPTNPGGVASFMTDRSTAALASERRAIADNFDINLLERPFTANEMDYKDYLDITRAELSLNGPFVYVTIYLEGSAPAEAEPTYAVEVDTDLDGHGDWLIMGLLPSSSDWTTTGVRACRDANGDVGGPTPMRSDSPNSARDGYEDCVFDSGYGIGPDEAWIRRDPGNADRVQIAFLFTLIGSDGEFLWGAWADEGVKEPGWFDYHDHFTFPEAGSPASNSSEYPIKALAMIDNTCRWGYGFVPTGSEPGVCYVPPTATPILNGSVSGIVWRDFDADGNRESGDSGIPGKTVRLYSGSCGSGLIGTTSTNGNGNYSFSDVVPGNYCVSVDFTCGSCSGECASTSHPRSFSVGSGENVSGINFGLYLQGPC
jgi:hypothetical protein